MELIDERGRLFGVVNVVDALVVLLVLAVVVAGAALVLGGGSEEADQEVTRTLTVTTDPVSVPVASLLSTGDSLTLSENATITDVYLTPARGEGVQATLQIRVTGELEDGVFTVDGKPIRVGQSVHLRSNEFELNGSILAVGTGESLPVRNQSVAVETRLPAATAAALEADQRLRIAGQSVASVTSVRSYPTNRSNVRRVELGVKLRTLALSDTAEFAGRPVRVGTMLPLQTDRYDLSGTVVNVGSTSPPGERTTVTARVVWEPVEPTVAGSVHVGATERTGGTTTARVTGRTVKPATKIVTSADGHVYARDHPRLRNVTLTVDLRARRTSAGTFFHGRPLRNGNTVLLDFGDTTVNATVVELKR